MISGLLDGHCTLITGLGGGKESVQDLVACNPRQYEQPQRKPVNMHKALHSLLEGPFPSQGRVKKDLVVYNGHRCAVKHSD